MNAYQINPPYGIEQLALVERPQPQPEHKQVLVRLRASSLNYRDLLVVKGLYSRNQPANLIPGSDGAGEVVAVGEGVTRFKLGNRVVANMMPAWIEGEPNETKAKTAMGGAVDGMLREYIAMDESGLLPIPEHLSFVEAATLPCAALTSWNAVTALAQIKPGDTVVVMGTGGVSIFALQFAKIAGARIIATSSQDAKLARLREMGAHNTLNYKSHPKWGEEVRRLTQGGADCIIEVGGAGTMTESLRAIRMGGTIALIGVLAGTGEMNPIPVLMRAIRLQGVFVGSRVMFEQMNRAISQHGIKPVIDRVFPFEQTP